MNGAPDQSEPSTDASKGSGATAGPGTTPAFRVARVLVALTTILAIVTVFTLGVRVQLLDTDEWVDLSAELLDDSEVQRAVATHLVDVLYSEVDVTAGLAELLPEDLDGLASPLAGVLRGPLTESVERLLDTDQFKSAWESANRAAHQALVGILRDETPEGISTAGGMVTLDLKEMVVVVGSNLGLDESLLDGLPDDAGQIVVFESDELNNVQRVVQVLDFLAWFLLLVVILMYALAVYIASQQRARVLRGVGWSVVSVGVVVLVARAIAIGGLVDVIVEDPTQQRLGENVASIGTALLRQMGWAAIFYGALIVLYTYLVGQGPWAVAVRRTLAPALNASRGVVAGGTAALLLLLVWWSPGRALDGWVTGITLVAMIIGTIVTLRARTLREFPDVTGHEVLTSLDPRRDSADVNK